MATKDLHNNIKVSRAISPVSVADNTASVSQILDTAGYESAELAIALGAIADADATFVVLLEESDTADLSGGNAVADADLLGTELAAGFQFDSDNGVRKLGYRGGKRYIRATITPAANASAALFSAMWIQSHARHAPVA